MHSLFHFEETKGAHYLCTVVLLKMQYLGVPFWIQRIQKESEAVEDFVLGVKLLCQCCNCWALTTLDFKKQDWCWHR